MTAKYQESSHIKKHEHGQSLLELAISLVLILTILAGVVDMGMAFFSWVAIRDASQEGAIFGAVAPENLDDIRLRVRSVSSSPVKLADEARVRVFIAPVINPDAPASGTLGCPGTPVTVLVEYDYQSITPGLSAFLGDDGSITIRATTTNTILRSSVGSCAP